MRPGCQLSERSHLSTSTFVETGWRVTPSAVRPGRVIARSRTDSWLEKVKFVGSSSRTERARISDQE